MKSLLLIAMTLLTASSAFAKLGLRDYDCTKGDDGIGGYYCHYDFSSCERTTCQEAAKCIAEKVVRDRIGVKTRAYLADSSPVVYNGENMLLHRIQLQKLNCNGRQCLMPLYVYTRPSIVRPGLCGPQVLTFLGAK